MSKQILDKKSKILQAATKLFSNLNFHDITLDQIAGEAEVGKGTIYNYFKNKNELFCQCILHDFEIFEAKSLKIIESESKFEQKLLGLAELQSEAFEKKGPLIQKLFQMGPKFEMTSDEFSNFFSFLEKEINRNSILFEQGINEGVLSDEFTPIQMAIMFHKAFDINILFKTFGQKKVGGREVAHYFMKMLKK